MLGTAPLISSSCNFARASGVIDVCYSCSSGEGDMVEYLCLIWSLVGVRELRWRISCCLVARGAQGWERERERELEWKGQECVFVCV